MSMNAWIDPDIEALFGSDGAFARGLPGFRVRAGQMEMASAVLDTLKERGVLVAEAGTGTGKTFAYLVPALLRQGKTILSTGTKNLQDQLFHRDLPQVCEVLGVSLQVALLKGRANYVCHHHLQRAALEGRFASRGEIADLKAIEAFAARSTTGDKSELGSVPESATIWPQVTSTKDNCLSQDCAFYEDCFVLAARRRALAADLVVVNHHLFFADLVLKDEGAGELLPQSEAVIFDEAHQVPDIASLFLGQSLQSTEWLEITREIRIEARTLAAQPKALEASLDQLDKAIRDLRLVFAQREGRFRFREVSSMSGWAQGHAGVITAIEDTRSVLGALSERSETLKRLHERMALLGSAWQSWGTRQEDASLLVYWIELFQSGVHLNATPLSVAAPFRAMLEAERKAWVFTSATLSVAGDFAHFQAALGLESAHCRYWESPFAFEEQALLYVPEGLPLPNTPSHTRAVLEAALPLIRANRGRAFLLFTSHRALREAALLLREALSQDALPYHILVQGEATRAELLDQFRRAPHPVLLGSQSFWEGVDVKGDQLSLVVIDKLPFTAPDDPVLVERLEALEAAGRQPFMEVQVPLAAVNLKQGAGRLIRDENDQGVLMIGDERLVSKGYGKKLWRSLPPMRRTRSEKEAVGFLQSILSTPKTPF